MKAHTVCGCDTEGRLPILAASTANFMTWMQRYVRQGLRRSCKCDTTLGQARACRQVTCGCVKSSGLHSAAACVCACCVACIEGKRPIVAAVMARCTGALPASRLPAWKVLLAGGGCSAITSSTTSTTGFLPVSLQHIVSTTHGSLVLGITPSGVRFQPKSSHNYYGWPPSSLLYI